MELKNDNKQEEQENEPGFFGYFFRYLFYVLLPFILMFVFMVLGAILFDWKIIASQGKMTNVLLNFTNKIL